MKNLTFQSTLWFVLFLVVLSACNKEQFTLPETSKKEAFTKQLQSSSAIATDVQIKEGVLVFKNEEDYRSTLLGLNKLSKEEQLTWEQSLGFISMQQLFNEIMTAEYDNSFSNHTDIYLNALKTGLISENELGYDLNIFNPAYAAVLDENGIVMVGSDLYQFTPNTLKIWKNGNLRNLETIIDAKESDSEIQILPMTSNVQLSKVNGEAYFWEDACQSEIGKSRLILSASFLSDFVYAPELLFIKYLVNIKSQTQSSPGNWYYDVNAKYKIKGTSLCHFELTDGDSIFDKDMEGNYSNKGVGGNVFLYTSDSGTYQFTPLYFTQAAELMSCEWSVFSFMSTNEKLDCYISK